MVEKVKFRICLLSIIWLFALVCSSSALQIIYPADGTYVTESNYLIIKGGQDPFLDGITIEINGIKSDLFNISSEQYRVTFADMVLLEPIFDSGENKIVVEGFVNNEKIAVAEATIYYYDELYEDAPEGYRREVFHSVEREAPCSGCHNMQPTQKQLEDPRPKFNPCGSCHARKLNQLHVHGPAGVYECYYCHDVASKPNKYQARPNDAAVCLECHEDSMSEFSGLGLIHGPIEAGSCSVCHDPHASDQPAQLVFEVNTLCLKCHAKVVEQPHVSSGTSGRAHPLEGPVNPVNPDKVFNCSSCHNPHGGAVPQYFMLGLNSRMQLCATCHKK